MSDDLQRYKVLWKKTPLWYRAWAFWHYRICRRPLPQTLVLPDGTKIEFLSKRKDPS